MQNSTQSFNYNNLFNNYNLFTFDCYIRPRFIIMESLRPNSIYYHLLFMELSNPLYSFGDFSEFISSETGISFVEYRDSINNFKEFLKKNTQSILVTNLYHHKEHNSYLNNPNIHFTIFHSYDSDICTIIDEDFTKNYGIPENRVEGMIYVANTVNYLDFKSLCNGINDEMFIKKYSNLPIEHDYNNYFIYYLPHLADEIKGKACSIQRILHNFQILLNEMLSSYNKYIHLIQSNINSIINNFNPLINEIKHSKKLLRMWQITDNGPFPDEIRLLCNRYRAFVTLQKSFYYILPENESKNIILQHLNSILKIHNTIRLSFRKSILSQDVNFILKIKNDHLKKLEIEERRFICLLLEQFHFIDESFSHYTSL